jgi:hypothetical protein
MQTITKLTGQTSVVAPLTGVAGTGVIGAGAVSTGVIGGLGLNTAPSGADCGNGASRTGALSVLVPSVLGTGVETGLSLGWGMVALDSSRVMRDERPTKAPKAVEAAAKHGAYLLVIGAGAAKKQDEQQINQAEAAFIGAEAVRSRAFRGPEPWRERT